MTVKHRFREGLETEDDLAPTEAPGAGPARAQRAPCLQAPLGTRDLPLLPPHLSGACWPGRLLQLRVPAPAHPPIPCPPGASFGTTARVSAGRGRSPPRSPRPVPNTHFLNPLQRHGSGRTAGTPAGGGRLRGSGAWGRPGLGSLAAGLAQSSGSPARRSLAPCGRRWLLRVCARARVCGRGRRRDSFVSAFASGKEPEPSPSAPRPAWHTGKCSSSLLLGHQLQEGSRDSLLTSTPQPGLRTARGWSW